MRSEMTSFLAGVQHRFAPDYQQVTKLESKVLDSANAQDYRLADYQYDSQILAQVHHLFDSAGISDHPKVILYDQDIPNAMCIHSGAIALSTGLIKRLPPDQREAVIAHEVAHYHQRSTNLMAERVSHGVAALMASLGTAAIIRRIKPLDPAVYRGLAKFWKGPDGNSSLFISTTVAMFTGLHFLTKKAMDIPFAWFVRKQELKADAGMVELTRNPEAFVGALNSIDNYYYERQNQSLIAPTDSPDLMAQRQAMGASGQAYAAAYHSFPTPQMPPAPPTHKPAWKRKYEELTAEHPETQTRVQKIRQQAAKMAQESPQGYGY